jgi:hypothetical protein
LQFRELHHAAFRLNQRYTCHGEADQWNCQPSSDNCGRDGSQEIDLRRGPENGMILANPKTSLPVVDLCSEAKGPTKSDDKIFRLSPMPLSACGL